MNCLQGILNQRFQKEEALISASSFFETLC